MTEPVDHIRNGDAPPLTKQQAKEQLAYVYRDQVADLRFEVEEYGPDASSSCDGCVYVHIGGTRRVDNFLFTEGDTDE